MAVLGIDHIELIVRDVDEFVDDRPGGVAAILRLGHVSKVDLKVNRFCHANGRAVARADWPEDEALNRWLNGHVIKIPLVTVEAEAVAQNWC